MPITVKGPNDVSISFPDGTDSGTINDVFSKQFGEQSAAPEKGALQRFGEAIPSGLVKGLGEGLETASYLGPAMIGLGPVSGELFKRKPLEQPVKTAETAALDRLPTPEGTAGAFGQSVGEYAGNPLSYVGPGGGALKLGTAVLGGLGAEAGGQLFKGTAAEPYARAAGGMIAGAGGAKAADVAANVASPASHAGADISRAVGRDAATPEAMLKKLEEVRKIRPDATLADVGGENVRGVVERVAQTPGAGRTQVIPALTARQQGQMTRISDDLGTLTGAQKSATQAIEQTMAARKIAADPLYDAAMNFNARQSPEIVDAWQNATAQGWGKQILESPDFKRTLQTEYGISDPVNAPFMKVIDSWKKEADGLVGEAIRSGNNNRARVIGEMRDRLVASVDQANPAYKTARAAWAGPSGYLDAIEDGRNILSPKVSSEEVRATIAGMSDGDKEAYRIGALASIKGKMGNDPAKLGDMTKYLRSPEVKAKIAAIMPDQQTAQSWLDRLEYEIGSSEITGRSLGNSATARRLAERDDADGMVGDLVMDALSHGVTGTIWRSVMALPKAARDTLRSRSDKALGELLTKPQSIDDLRRTLNQGQPQSAVSGSVLRSALAGASPLANSGP